MNARRNTRTNNLTIESAAGLEGLAQDMPFCWSRREPPLITNRAHNSDCRAYLRGLRAAEMAAWEQSGGDYLLSDYVARDFATTPRSVAQVATVLRQECQ